MVARRRRRAEVVRQPDGCLDPTLRVTLEHLAPRVPSADVVDGFDRRATRTSAGLPHVRLHDLRHFYASGLIAAGCDVVTVQRALGHSSATTTLNTYSHLWPTAEDRTRAAAADLMNQAVRLSLNK
ncbi:MAG: tyrosine-type recombinase/integrase [Nocardioides sp.]